MSGTSLTTKYSYDSQYNRQTVTDPAGDATTTTAYPSTNSTAYGLVDTVVDPNNNTRTVNSYDNYGDPTKTTDALSRTATATFNTLGWKKTSTDGAGHTTQYFYDNWGRPISVLLPDNTSTRTVYDNDSNVVETQDTDAVSGKLTGTYAWTTGVFGTPNLYFYGASNSGYLLLNNAGAIFPGSGGMGNQSQYGAAGTISLSAWVYPSTADQTGGPYDIIDQAAPSTTSAGNENYLHISGGQLQFGAWNGTSNSQVSYTLPSADYNATELVTGTCDGKTWTLYVNGTKVASAAASWGALNCSEPWSVGGSPTQGNYYAGGVDELRIYNRALTSSEVSQLDNWNPSSSNPTQAPSDGLSHYWNFNENAGTLVYDSCHSNFYTYDADNRLTQKVNGRGDVTTYLYDGYDPRNTSLRQYGQLSGMTNGNDVTTYYGYDVRGAKNYVDYPDGTTESMTYDSDGNIVTHTDRDNNATSYVFDAADRLTNVNYPTSPGQGIFATPNVTFTYDGANRMSTMMDSQQGTGYNANQTYTYWGYDNASRVTEMNTPSEYIGYSYDADGNLKQRTYGGTTKWNYSYDADNEVTQVKTPDMSGNQFTVGMSYNTDGKVATKTLASGSTVSYSYDAFDEPTTIKTTNPNVSGTNGTLQSQIGYTYDDLHNIVARTDFTGGSGNQYGDQQSAAYEYDGGSEMTYENTISSSYADSPSSYPHVFAFSYTYDHNQNRLSKDFGPGSNGNSSSDYVESYAYDDSTDQLTGNGSNTYNYNDDGDLVSVYNGSTEVASYGYDMQNRLVSYANPQTSSSSTSYYYTGQGGRYLVKNSTDGRWQSIDGQGATSSVLYDGQYLSNPGLGFYNASYGKYFDFNADASGSVTGLFSASDSGQEQEGYAYDAFGTQPNAPTGELSFSYGQYQEYGAGAGYQSDPETGLIRCGNRYYDPSIGRFITNDPAQQGTNWYAYCANNPTNLSDPTGLDWNGNNWTGNPKDPSQYQGTGSTNGFTDGSTFTATDGDTATLTNGVWVWNNGADSESSYISMMGTVGIFGLITATAGYALGHLNNQATTQTQFTTTAPDGTQTEGQIQTQTTTQPSTNASAADEAATADGGATDAASTAAATEGPKLQVELL